LGGIVSEKGTGFGCGLTVLILALVPIVVLFLVPLAVVFGVNINVDFPSALVFFLIGVLAGLLAAWIYRKASHRDVQQQGFEVKTDDGDNGIGNIT
jgi:hypothetical protein